MESVASGVSVCKVQHLLAGLFLAAGWFFVAAVMFMFAAFYPASGGQCSWWLCVRADDGFCWQQLGS
jgi:hypothetical protein